MTFPAIRLQAESSLRRPTRPGAAGKYRHPRVSVVERSQPALGAGELLLRVCQVSICGTDTHVMEMDAEGYSCSSAPAANWERGIQFGHEFAGQVLARGPGVHGFQVGDYVTSDSLVPCRLSTCPNCRREQWNACPRAYLLGLQAHGAFGECAVVPAGSAHPIDRLIQRYELNQGLRAATLAEPLGVALHAFHQASRWARMSTPQVLIFGAGPIGMFFAWKARLAGASPIVVIEPNPGRREIARRFADLVVAPDQFGLSALISETFDSGPDVVVEACGQADWETILEGLAPGGVAVTVARTGQQLAFASDTLITKGQAILGVRGHVGRVPEAIDLLVDGGVDPELFLTRSLDGLDQLAAFLREPQSHREELKATCRIDRPSILKRA